MLRIDTTFLFQAALPLDLLSAIPHDHTSLLHDTVIDFEKEKAKLRDSISSHDVNWVDLSSTRPTTLRPGMESFFDDPEEPSKHIKKVWCLGNEEFDPSRLAPFVSETAETFSIGGCSTQKWLLKMDSPTGLSSGPFPGTVVKFFNHSHQTLKLADFAESSSKNWYVDQFLAIRPAVTVLELGLYDALEGRIIREPGQAKAGVFSAYVRQKLDSFLWMVKDKSKRSKTLQDESVAQLLKDHIWLFILPPCWYQHVEECMLPQFVSPHVFQALRKYIYRDMGAERTKFWEEVKLWSYHPKMPKDAKDDALKGNYVLGTRLNRYYLANVFNVARKLLCDRSCCNKAVSATTLAKVCYERCSCGPFLAYYSTLDEPLEFMFQNGQFN